MDRARERGASHEEKEEEKRIRGGHPPQGMTAVNVHTPPPNIPHNTYPPSSEARELCKTDGM